MKKGKEKESIIGRAFAGHAARDALAHGDNPKLAEKASGYDNSLTDMVNLFIAHAKARRSIEEAQAGEQQ